MASYRREFGGELEGNKLAWEISPDSSSIVILMSVFLVAGYSTLKAQSLPPLHIKLVAATFAYKYPCVCPSLSVNGFCL
jgi:hypothetical protein